MDRVALHNERVVGLLDRFPYLVPLLLNSVLLWFAGLPLYKRQMYPTTTTFQKPYVGSFPTVGFANRNSNVSRWRLRPRVEVIISRIGNEERVFKDGVGVVYPITRQWRLPEQVAAAH